MNTKIYNSTTVELSYDEMIAIYGGGWLKDLLEYIDKNYTELKRGISDGYNYR